MSDQPDLTTLAQRMRYAATVLEEANKRYGMPPDAAGKPSELRSEADVVADEDKETAGKEALVCELAREMLAAFGYAPDTRFHKSTRIAAELLIQKGWTKS